MSVKSSQDSSKPATGLKQHVEPAGEQQVKVGSDGSLDLLAATMQDVVKALQEGRVTSEQLVKEYLARIDKDNKQGLELRAVIEVRPTEQLLAAARDLDEKRAAGNVQSVLHGVPILIKDIIDTHPSRGLKNTCGLIALEGQKVERNAPVVDYLTEVAGVILLGKTNLQALSGGYTFYSPQGWSPRGGQGYTPFGRYLKPLGSSSGCGAAVAAGMAPLSIGAETSGSISQPSHVNSLFGLKPSVGLINGEGSMQQSWTQDSLGPLGKSAWDVAAALGLMTSPPRDYLSWVEKAPPLSSFRLGIVGDQVSPEEEFEKSPLDAFVTGASPALKAEARALWEEAKGLLAPATVASDVKLPDLGSCKATDDCLPTGPRWWDENGQWLFCDEDLVLSCEYRQSMERYLAERGGEGINSVAKLMEWCRAHPKESYYDSSAVAKIAIIEKTLEREPEDYRDQYLAALIRQKMRGREINALMDSLCVDALVCAGGIDGTSLASSVVACGRLPLASVPFKMLNEDGRHAPWGIRIIGRRGDEGRLLSIMAACEKAFPPRSVPEPVRRGRW